MKKQKVTLENLKVKSFVTDLKTTDANTVKGGTDPFTIGVAIGIGVATATYIIDWFED